MTRALTATLLLGSLPALAWDSVCFRYQDTLGEPAALATASRTPCSPSSGPETARQRWIGPLDEHRSLWEATVVRAGLPASTAATQLLTVYTTDALAAGSDAGTLVPAPFEAVTRIVQRGVSAGELTHLPDYSYALWDWASGHETCPLDPAQADPVACHDFASHMGPVNSNHFLPQAQTFFATYHGLALARAAECRALGVRLAPANGRFDGVVRACELEALDLEAVGHHYLQDAWSMGHMWQRWGSSNLSDFEGATTDDKRDRAVLVALVSGLFHGARGVLQVLPGWTSFDVNDAMGAPSPEVRFATSTGELHTGVGDDYLSTLPPATVNPAYDFQAQRFFDCATSALLAVYRASGEAHGVATPQGGTQSLDPLGDACFGQRATNAAMLAGAAVNFKAAGLQVTLPLDARFVSWMLPKVARAQGKVPVAPKLRNQFRHELARIVTRTRITAKDSPTGTSLASGGLGTFLGAKPNAQYTAPATYLEPPLPWQESAAPTTEAATRATWLARTFHLAHAQELCASMDAARLAAVRAHAQDTTLDATAKAAACSACAAVTVRHLRLGTASSWDTTREPLCTYLGTPSGTPALVYHQVSGVTDPAQVAAQYCCP